MPFLGTRAAGSVRGFGFLARVVPPVTESAYTTPGTYSWICPAGVTSVCAVVIGGGGGGSTFASFSGGNLAYKNNITVTPGVGYTVVVGQGGAGLVGYDGTIGGQSYFIDPNTLQAFGGHQGSVNPPYVGDGGGQGGSGGTFYGGGGAAGYTGNGGIGGTVFNSAATAGSGGGGGGGGSNLFTEDSEFYIYNQSSGGGGVGFLGQGSNGAAGTNSTYAGTGGLAGSSATGSFAGNGQNSGGTAGNVGGNGGNGGGGGGCGLALRDKITGAYILSSRGGNGGPGRVRIIWGAGRSFPSTNTGTI